MSSAQNTSREVDPSGLSIGAIALSGRALLAPLSGVTDLGMRRAAQAFGASLVVTEMVAADAYIAADEETRLRAEGGGMSPHVIQIAGRTPAAMAEASRLAEAAGADAIDINMGCPAKRVVGGYAGSALMREPDLATQLVHAVVKAVRVPVCVKMRLGWDENSCNAPELALRFEREGVAMITIHGRTRSQFYKGLANWRAIRAVREAITIPLVANGDCCTSADARTMLAQSGADAVMIGRAAVGQPWRVGSVASSLRGETPFTPSPQERRDAALAHYDWLLSSMGTYAGVRHARKHLVAYARAALEDGFPVCRDLTSRLATSENPREVQSLLYRLWDGQLLRAAA